jgi:hypothetical protein
MYSTEKISEVLLKFRVEDIHQMLPGSSDLQPYRSRVKPGLRKTMNGIFRVPNQGILQIVMKFDMGDFHLFAFHNFKLNTFLHW